MAGEVAEIEKAIGGENLARVLAGLYNQWWIQRNPKEAEWRELRNYLFATDTTSTSNSALPWKNKTTLPKLTQIRDNLHANYMDALFPNEDWMKWEGSTMESSTMKKRGNRRRERMKRGRKNVKCCRNPKRKQILKNVGDYAAMPNEKHMELLKSMK